MTLPATDDALVQAIDHPIKLPIFEGPLDLLLFLIRKNEVDIYDIHIAEVTRQYIEVIYRMERLNLEVAGEFFVMAATLMHIKSRMLLPKSEQVAEDEGEDEEADPRWELVQQLLEYKKFKEAAAALGQISDRAADLLPRHYVLRKEDRPEIPVRNSDRIEVWNTFNQVLRRLAERITVGHIHDEVVTIADRMEFILQTLRTRPRFLFSELFQGSYSLNTLVATFLAVLELTRLRKISVEQDEAFGDIQCEARGDPRELFQGDGEDAAEDFLPD